MPDVIDKFFAHFDKKTKDYFSLLKLDPGFQMVFNESERTSIPAEWSDLEDMFESIEPGAKDKLNKFMEEAEFKYNVGVKDLVYQPGLSITELIRPDLLTSVFKLQVFSSFHSHVRKFF
jgi:phytoene desaturase